AKNWLNGVWLGHPLHPALTDVPIGAWWAGAALDLVGARSAADAAITVGVLTAVPTALAGAADWSDTEAEQRRTGLVHALLNSVGLTCMIGSLFARRGDQRGVGVVLSMLGLTVTSFSAWLGGELVYKQGTNVSRNAFEPHLDEFKPVMRMDELQADKLVGAEVEIEGTKLPIVLLKTGQNVLALSGVCSHWGGPLAEGKIVDHQCVECPWHGSTFDMADGSVRQGPATVPAPVFETRVQGGNVEVRTRR
ncbi:MAG: Rieske 2Fe-2S domain-containing protein, partial [Chloroflexi bacterium]|nr:Rieske 2Fe-2S domain-containing protein [Chloroflexota bacterium]